MADNELQNLLKSGIQAARNGNKVVARSIFEQVLKQDAQNEMAWMWMASVLENPIERQKALRRVLAINPNNDRAKQALDKLQAASPAAPSIAPPPRPVVEDRPPAPPRAPSSRTPLQPPPAPAAPPKRQTGPLVVTAPSQRRGGLSTPLYLLIGIIAIALIGAGLFLAVQQLNEEEVTPTAVAQPPLNQIATFTVPPPPTQPAIVIVPGASSGQNLGATWTPIPSATNLPTFTPTPPLPDRGEFQLVFARQENPVALNSIQSINGDGTGLNSISIALDAGNLIIEGIATAEPEEQPSTEEPTGTEEPASIIPAAVLYENLEFLDPAYSPDGTSLVFTAQLSADVQELFVMSLPDGTPRQLTTLGAANTSGAIWTPDGAQIIFASDADGDFEIYRVDAAGGEPTNTTDNSFQDRDPTLSPDGRLLVIASDRSTPGELEIWAIPQGSGEPEQYTSAINSSFSPAFSPDGTRIAFISNRGSDNDLYVMNADGTNEQLLTTDDADADDRYPAWSPDNNWIAVSSDREGSRVLQLWLVRADGVSEWQALTSGNGSSRDANWRPQ